MKISELYIAGLAILFWYGVGMTTLIASAHEIDDQLSNKVDMYISHSVVTTEKASITTAQIILSTANIPLNAFEIELHFDPAKVVPQSVVAHPNLCEDRFVIEKTIDITKGVIYMSCGSTNPFVTGEEFEPVLTVVLSGEKYVLSEVSFGEKTNFYIHDGLGTQAVLRMFDPSV